MRSAPGRSTVVGRSLRGAPGATSDRRRTQMKTWVKVLIVTLLMAIPAFVLGPALFAPADVGSAPSAAQMPYFMFLAALDAILLGLGVSFLVFGFPILREVSPDSQARAWAMYLSFGSR